MPRERSVPQLIGRSAAFRQTLQLAQNYARSEWPVLLLGETGVGKEEIAHFVHLHSSRAGAPFLPVNCAALPAGLFESELFGHERGAFSGALQASRGLLRSAAGGTVFLDEIGDLDLCLQAKLLRVLDSGEVRAVGSSRVEECNFRLIAATNVNLHRAVALGRFRADLLQRIHVLVVEVPPLRSRCEDIALIATHVLGQWGRTAEPEALRALTEFEWPTNVRQLINLLKRVVACGEPLTGPLIQRALGEERRYLELARDVGLIDSATLSLAEIEKQVILQRLSLYRGNRKATARDLGIAKSTLHDKLQRFKLRSAEKKIEGHPRFRGPGSHGLRPAQRGSGRSHALDL